MAVHPHGLHDCQCVTCGYIETVEANVKCNTLACPNDGTRLRAVETGEYRISQGETHSIFWPILGASVISGIILLLISRKVK
jgi:hypothetical protein